GSRHFHLRQPQTLRRRCAEPGVIGRPAVPARRKFAAHVSNLPYRRLPVGKGSSQPAPRRSSAFTRPPFTSKPSCRHRQPEATSTVGLRKAAEPRGAESLQSSTQTPVP